MAGWILSGYIGAGKSCYAVRWIAEYMSAGHRACSNIPIYGWCDHKNDLCPMVVASPIIGYMRQLGWQYQPGQYVHIPYEKMVGNPAWFQLIPAGRSRDDKMLCIVDETSDLFDVNDRDSIRRNDNQVMRECLRFIRLSRHAHIELCFIMQNEGLTMTALTKLCEHRLKVLNFAYFFEKYHLPFTINKTLVTHTYNHGLIAGKSRIVNSKDRRLWACYKSEAFQDAIGVKADGVVFDPSAGRLKGWEKKQNKEEFPMWFKLAVVACLVLTGLSIKMSFRTMSAVDAADLRYSKFLADYAASQAREAGKRASASPSVVPASVGRSGASGVRGRFLPSSPSQSFEPAPVRCNYETVSGSYMYHCAGDFAWCEFEGVRLDVGGPSEWGDIKRVTPHFAIAQDADGVFTALVEGLPRSRDIADFSLSRKDSQN